MGIYLSHCVHGNECTWTHDALCDTFATVVQDVGFHMGHQKPHAFPSTMFNSSCQHVNVVFIKDNFLTLVHVVIANPTWANLLPRSSTTLGLVASNATQAKKWSYPDQYLVNQFLPLAVEVFQCLHKDVDVFLHNCANAIWILKGLKGLLFFVLVTFFWQKNSITLQRLQASSILSWALVLGLIISRLPPL
jgi:hypothetical protein